MSALETTMSPLGIAHSFGLQPDFTLGVEEELLIVEPSGTALRTDAERVVAAATPIRGRLAAEIFAAEIELITPVCRTVAEAAGTLAELALVVAQAGVDVVGAGLYPAAAEREADLCRTPRYKAVADALQGLLRTPPAALHVHVGMPDPDTALTVANGLRRHLPLIHAIAANSPFWFGRDSGHASARAAILRSYPRFGVPPRFSDWEQFSALTSELADAAGVEDYTYVWWEVRPHPQLGTIEVRAPDAQFSLERTIALVAFIHALARREADAPLAPAHSRDWIEEGCYQATRYGLDARLIDDDGRHLPARMLAREMLARLTPYARELGCADELAGIERILRDGGGAEIQRRIAGERGMSGLLHWLAGQRAPRAGR